jgi:hypothetical protein
MVTYKLVKHQNMTSTKISNKTSTTYDKIHDFHMSCYEKRDQLCNNRQTNVYTHFQRCLDMERHMKRAEEYYEIHGKYPPNFYNVCHGKKRQRQNGQGASYLCGRM